MTYEVPMASEGCPLCEWNGHIAETHTRKSMIYTHVTIEADDRGRKVLVERGACMEPRRPSIVQTVREVLSI